MNVTIFGGAFDPPHKGHLAVASALIEQSLADEVWFLPVKQHAFAKQMSSSTDRLAMLALAQQPKTRIELFEYKEAGPSYTYKTLTALVELYPDHDFSFVIGSDNLARFHLWDEYEKLVAEFPFFIYPRAGFALAPLRPNMRVIPNVQAVEISSTQVRQRVSSGQSISDLVQPAVEQYILEKKLYVKN